MIGETISHYRVLEKIESGSLELGEALNLAIQVADGFKEAAGRIIESLNKIALN